jgi:hypothetical protein
MKEKEEASVLNIIGLLFKSLILLFILGYGLSIYHNIKVNNELNYKRQTEKVETNKRKSIREILIGNIEEER